MKVDRGRFEPGVERPDPLEELAQVTTRSPKYPLDRALTLDGRLVERMAAEIELLRAAFIEITGAGSTQYVVLTDVGIVDAYNETDEVDIVLFRVP